MPARPRRHVLAPFLPVCLLASSLLVAPGAAAQNPGARPRARDVGVRIGVLPTGPLNAITDVRGVEVGQFTLREGDSVRTGVTAILPHRGNLFRQKVRAAVVVGNGFGKLVGSTQVNELGEIETPILLTGTLSVWRAADALVDTMLEVPGNEDVRSINPVVGETNDGYLSDIRIRPIRPEHVRAALRAATGGPVEEGSVGAGTGTRALGWKGGIGTASRVLPDSLGGYTVGVLTQTNYGGSLTIDGVHVGKILGEDPGASSDRTGKNAGGSVMIVLATDAPLSHLELSRLGRRTFLGISRTGSYMSYGSGDYAITFSTADVQAPDARPVREPAVLSALFHATVEATEEAAVNSIFRATTVTGYEGHRTEALPLDRVLPILRSHAVIQP